MKKDETLFVGLEIDSGEEVEVPIFHTLTTGQTQLSGKTTVQKKFAELLAERGFKVLIFDTKENLEDYSGLGKEIPVCLRESTDPLVLLPLLESIFKRRLPTGYYSVLSEVSSGTETFGEVIKRAKDIEQSTRSGWKQGACRTLYDLLERLEDQLAKVETVSTLELPYSINRMVLNYFPRASQQLFIRNAFEDILRIHNKMTIPMLDEFYKFHPQRWGSACASAIQDVITQTAITKTFCYLATQFLAPTNKDPLKACAVRLLGTQDHKTEAKHTLDLIPFRNVATEDDIMTLPVGHFYVTTKKWVKLTYFLPKGVPKKIGRDVALGKKTSEWVQDNFLKPVERPTQPRRLKSHPLVNKKFEKKFTDLIEEMKQLDQTVLHLQKTTKADLIQIRNDFFGKISTVTQRISELQKKMLDFKVDPQEIVSLVLQKMPTQQIDEAAILEKLAKRFQGMTGTVVYEVAPLEKLKRDFQEAAKAQILQDVAGLDKEQTEMLKFIESLGRGTKTTEIMTKCFFMSESSGSRRRLNDKLQTMESSGLIRRDKAANIYANLKKRITGLLAIHEAKPEEMEAVYDHIIMKLIGEKRGSD